MSEAPRVIHKRTWTPFFDAIFRGDKNGEVRLNDFDVKAGDTLILDEWNPDTGYTGLSLERKVKAVFPVDFSKFHTQKEIEEHGHLYIELENPRVEALEVERDQLKDQLQDFEKSKKLLKEFMMKWADQKDENLALEKRAEGVEAEIGNLRQVIKELRIIRGLAEARYIDAEARLAQAKGYPEKLRQALIMEGHSETVVNLLRELEVALGGAGHKEEKTA